MLDKSVSSLALYFLLNTVNCTLTVTQVIVLYAAYQMNTDGIKTFTAEGIALRIKETTGHSLLDQSVQNAISYLYRTGNKHIEPLGQIKNTGRGRAPRIYKITRQGINTCHSLLKKKKHGTK